MTSERISVVDDAGEFAEDKDVARKLRVERILPALDGPGDVVLDFDGVNLATQSFIHALISDVIRRHGSDVMGRIVFRNCNETVRALITIVADYSQEGLGALDT